MRVKNSFRCIESRIRRWGRQLLPFSGDVVVLHNEKVIYLAIPKAANTTFHAVCVDVLTRNATSNAAARGPGVAMSAGMLRNAKSRSALKKQGILIGKDRIHEFGNYWKFTVVRNPWDRLVSCWADKIAQNKINDRYYIDGVATGLASYSCFHAGMDFPQFAEIVAAIPDRNSDPHFRSQVDFVTDRQDRLLVDFVAKVEDLPTSASLILKKMNAHKLRLPHILKSKRGPYRSYYDQTTRLLVEQRYRKDIAAFEYEF